MVCISQECCGYRRVGFALDNEYMVTAGFYVDVYGTVTSSNKG